jgi:hypothetical protein
MPHRNTIEDREIIPEVYRALLLLGADSELLGVVGSWKNGLPNEDVLLGLRAWNTASLAEVKACIAHYEISCPHSDYIRDEVPGNAAVEG